MPRVVFNNALKPLWLQDDDEQPHEFLRLESKKIEYRSKKRANILAAKREKLSKRKVHPIDASTLVIPAGIEPYNPFTKLI